MPLPRHQRRLRSPATRKPQIAMRAGHWLVATLMSLTVLPFVGYEAISWYRRPRLAAFISMVEYVELPMMVGDTSVRRVVYNDLIGNCNMLETALWSVSMLDVGKPVRDVRVNYLMKNVGRDAIENIHIVREVPQRWMLTVAPTRNVDFGESTETTPYGTQYSIMKIGRLEKGDSVVVTEVFSPDTTLPDSVRVGVPLQLNLRVPTLTADRLPTRELGARPITADRVVMADAALQGNHIGDIKSQWRLRRVGEERFLYSLIAGWTSPADGVPGVCGYRGPPRQKHGLGYRIVGGSNLNVVVPGARNGDLIRQPHSVTIPHDYGGVYRTLMHQIVEASKNSRYSTWPY